MATNLSGLLAKLKEQGKIKKEETSPPPEQAVVVSNPNPNPNPTPAPFPTPEPEKKSDLYKVNPDLPFDLQEKLADLHGKIIDKHPAMPSLLRDIHSTLAQYPENVTLLSEQDIGIIVSGLKAHTQVQIVASTSKSAKSASLKKKISAMSDDDF